MLILLLLTLLSGHLSLDDCVLVHLTLLHSKKLEAGAVGIDKLSVKGSAEVISNLLSHRPIVANIIPCSFFLDDTLSCCQYQLFFVPHVVQLIKLREGILDQLILE